MTDYSVEVWPQIPAKLSRLTDLAANLRYSWDRHVRGLFRQLDAALYQSCGHNPKIFLRRVDQARLDAAAEDPSFVAEYQRAVSAHDHYLQDALTPLLETSWARQDVVAYFCFEFGFHESLPIYSGGLGILAGDHCKAASDLGLPLVAVGLLYRQGYFNQHIDGEGNQIVRLLQSNFDELPIALVLDAEGKELRVSVHLQSTEVQVRLWCAEVGRNRLYLLDADLAENHPEARTITYQLYGGDARMRLRQEMLLGLGGVRALRALGIAPKVWHINEGHAAFLILERCRELCANGWSFAAAWEAVAACTVFTTHTPVAAGHDSFPVDLALPYLNKFAAAFGLGPEELLALGQLNSQRFNMTTLALRGSRFHNGVSRIHGGVAAVMEKDLWPQIDARDNPIGSITNGVHLETFLAQEWVNLFDMRLPGWRNELAASEFWQRLFAIPDHRVWSLRQELKAELKEEVKKRLLRQLERNGAGVSATRRMTRFLQANAKDVLILGFARRFATYKRAGLLFHDFDRLCRVLTDAARPVVLIMAGKAHPNDGPGQDLIRNVHRLAQTPELLGHVLLVEGYDMALARALVAGVDVWLNTPEYPLEASGTSGQKAGMNGTINLSVLDGWWAEGYAGDNGWGVTPHDPSMPWDLRFQHESDDLLDLLENEVVPEYYAWEGGYSTSWIARSKRSMASIIPKFNAERMVGDYVQRLYAPAARQQVAFANDREKAQQLADWKRNLLQAWPKVRIQREDFVQTPVNFGATLLVQVLVYLNGLRVEDVAVECVVTAADESMEILSMTAERDNAEGEVRYRLQWRPSRTGILRYRVRMYPRHPHLSHPFEMGCMLWAD